MQTAIELDASSVDAQRDYGYVMEMMGYWSAAIESYHRALEINPHLAYIYMDLGRNYQYMSDTASAIESFRRATELDPGRADAWDQLGWTYYVIDDYEMARTYLRQAVEADPDYAPAYGHLAITFWDRRDYEDAIPNFERAIELAYQETRRSARSFYVTIEPTQDEYLYPSLDVAVQGDFAWGDRDHVRLAATLTADHDAARWADASGRLVLNVMNGEYTLSLQGMPPLPYDQVYVGWFEGVEGLDNQPLSTGPFRVSSEGAAELRLTAEPVAGPRIEHLYTLGLCYFYMAHCERAYPLFEAALQIDPEEVNALEGIRLCQESEATPTVTP